MSTLHEAKAEWGIFHMLIAQAVLRRPIHVAQPVEGNPCWHMEPITEIVRRFVCDDDIDVPEAPRGEPLQLLPTKVTEVPSGHYELGAMTYARHMRAYVIYAPRCY